MYKNITKIIYAGLLLLLLVGAATATTILRDAGTTTIDGGNIGGLYVYQGWLNVSDISSFQDDIDIAGKITIDQNANEISLNIDSEATTSHGIYIDMAASYSNAAGAKIQQDTNNYVELINNVADSSGSSLFYRNYVSASTASPLLVLTQDNAGDDQNVLNIQQDGTGKGLLINHNAEGIGLNIETSATDQSGLLINNNAAFVGAGYADSLISARLDNAASTGNVMEIQQDGTGKGLLIDQNGNGDALVIENAGNQASIRLDSIGAGIEMKSPDGTTYCLNIANGGTTNITAGGCIK